MQGKYSIFASVGNSTQPFDRFLRMVDEAAGRLNLRTLIQTGASAYPPLHAERVDFVPRPEFDQLCRTSDHLVMHAGEGSVMAAIRFGKVPIVVARRGDLGEHVNNHQLELAAEFPKLGWCRVAADAGELIALLQSPPAFIHGGEIVSNERMRELVTEFIR